MSIKLSEAEIKLFDKMEKFHKIAEKCPHVKEHKFVSIPTFLPKCELTDDACRYENCPKLSLNKDKLEK